MKAQFQGKLLIEIPKNIPIYNLLTGNFGKEFLEEYDGIVKVNYKDNQNLRKLDFSEGVVKGSNTYSVFLANDILSKYGLRTADPADIQKIVSKDNSFLKEFYVDLGLVLREENEPNKYLAEQLGKQAKERKYKFSNEKPLFFKASDLELILDNDSPSGLGFKIKDRADPINAHEISYKNNEKKFSKTNGRGFPIFDKIGNRINYARESGLSRVYLDGDSDLSSRSVGLAYSTGGGRVVVINDAEGTSAQNFVRNSIAEKREKLDLLEKEYSEKIKNI